jgi:hypothetical protein
LHNATFPLKIAFYALYVSPLVTIGVRDLWPNDILPTYVSSTHISKDI